MRSAAAVIASILVITSLYFTIVLIESGNVGVRKTLGKVNPEEATPGLNIKIGGVHNIVFIIVRRERLILLSILLILPFHCTKSILSGISHITFYLLAQLRR